MQRLSDRLIRPLVTVAGVALVLALGVGSLAIAGAERTGAQPAPTASASPLPTSSAPADPSTAQPAPPAVDAQLFARTELYFGSERPGRDVSQREFMRFLDAEVTPRFPDGLTLLSGRGQFREADGTIVEEASFVLILFYPYEDRAESSALVEEIRRLYVGEFDQQSVLRVDDPRPVQVSF